MKRLAIFILLILHLNLCFAQIPDTLQTPGSEQGDSEFTALIALILFVVGYIVIKNFKQKKAPVTIDMNPDAPPADKEEEWRIQDALRTPSLYYFKVKGMTQYKLRRPGGYIVELYPETDNEKDPYAISLIHQNLGIIGYLPKGNKYVHEMARNAKIYGAVEIGISSKGYPWGKFWLDPTIFKPKDIKNMKDVLH